MIASNLVFAPCLYSSEQTAAEANQRRRGNMSSSGRHCHCVCPVHISNFQKPVPVHRDSYPTVSAHYFLLTYSLRNSALNYCIPATTPRPPPRATCNWLMNGQKSSVTSKVPYEGKEADEYNSSAILVLMVISDLY